MFRYVINNENAKKKKKTNERKKMNCIRRYWYTYENQKIISKIAIDYNCYSKPLVKEYSYNIWNAHNDNNSTRICNRLFLYRQNVPTIGLKHL